MNTDAATRPIIYLSEILQFPEPDPQIQDWGIIMSDMNRVVEFCDVYETFDLTDLEKFFLVELIVASYDDFLSVQGSDEKLWSRIATFSEA